ncbi:MAG TPA: hypothetical protein VM115_07710, partial [Vicinamibacterales bacterium]|nr:hypothetical protein [Vicinamibacterales bacterium]
MDLGLRSPMLDFFRRGEVAKDVRMLAASGALAPRALDQIGLLAMLTDDADADIRAAAEATLASIPHESMAGFLGRSDVPEGLREFFRARGIEPVSGGDTSDEPLVDAEAAAGVNPATEARDAGEAVEAVGAGEAGAGAEEEEENQSMTQKLALMNVAERMKAAMKGSKSERAVLIRDPNKLVSAAVLSSPKLTESEVENIAKLANVSEEVLRTIGQNRSWTKNYGVIAALTK